MATKAKAAKKTPDILTLNEAKNDWQRLAEHIREYPALYAAGALFVVVCLVAGLVYRVNTAKKSVNATTQFAKAVATEDAALRATEMEQLAQKGPLAADALYLAGEAAYQAKDYAKARENFQRVRGEFPTSKFTPDAVEGLGYIAENEGDLDAALAAYKEIIEKWPASVTRRRQEINIGRVQERKGNFKEAVEAYKAHLELYPESSFKNEADQALAKLEQSHPELFPQAEAEAAAAAPAPATEAPAAAAPAPAAPAAGRRARNHAGSCAGTSPSG